jgi:hypothetical protein
MRHSVQEQRLRGMTSPCRCSSRVLGRSERAFQRQEVIASARDLELPIGMAWRPQAPRAHAVPTRRGRFPGWYSARAEGRMSPIWAGPAAGSRRIVSTTSRRRVRAVEAKNRNTGSEPGRASGSGLALPNKRVSPSHSAVTARANSGTRLARGRAGYAHR